MNHFIASILPGLTTFVTMAYITAVNPTILGTEGTGMPRLGVVTSTVATTVIFSLVMAVFVRGPYAIAPGMGLNTFFAFGIILSQGIPWTQALGITFWAGMLLVLVTSIPCLRKVMLHLLPENVALATVVGLGLFISFIGCKNCGLIEADPHTLVRLAPISIKAMLSALGIVITVVLFLMQKDYAALVGVVVVSAIALFAGEAEWPSRIISMPYFSTFFVCDAYGAMRFEYLPLILAVAVLTLGDSVAVIKSIAKQAQLIDPETQEPYHFNRALMISAWSVIGSSFFGTSPPIVFLENAAGVAAGGRNGASTAVVALLFLPLLFFAPLVQGVPASAVAGTLFLIGALMFTNARHLQLDTPSAALPAFVTIAGMVFTASIANGLFAGLFVYFLLWLCSRKGKHTKEHRA